MNIHDILESWKSDFLEAIQLLVSSFFQSFSFEFLKSFFLIFGLYLVIAFFHVILSASPKITKGYVCDWTGKPLIYKLNGLRVLILTELIFVLGHYYNLWDGSYLSTHSLSLFWGGFWLAIGICFWFYWKGLQIPFEKQENSRTCLTVGMPVEPSPWKNNIKNENNFFYNFYSGFEFNPRFYILGSLFDVKMYLYLVGAILLELFILSGVFRQVSVLGYLTKRMICYVFLFSWFVHEYNYHEFVHLYTYDLFAEKIGFKLIWGCLVFYPFFYPIGSYYILDIPSHEDFSNLEFLFCLIIFFSGWILSRGANNQKYYFKTHPTEKFLGITPKCIPNSKLLVSGWWSLSRHINYLGEILMAIGLAYPGRTLAWLYPLYYVALLFPRERYDNYICAKKYGDKWTQYCNLVPYRIIPYIY